MTTTNRPLVLSVTEAGNLLGVSRSTAYELVRTGELHSIKLRRRVVVPTATVAERLGITVPEVWLALGWQPNDFNAQTRIARGRVGGRRARTFGQDQTSRGAPLGTGTLSQP